VDRNEEPRSEGVPTSADPAAGGGGASDDATPVVLAEPEGPADVEGPADIEGSADAEGPADGEGPAELDGSVATAGDGVESATTGLGGAQEPMPVEAAAADPAETSTADDPTATAATDAPVPSRKRVSLRRGAAVAAAVLVGALAVSAFSTVVPSSGDADQHFVDTARSQGRVVAGGDQQALLVSAARKICERRGSHTTVAQRRATALSSDELAVIQQTFAGDTRGFTALALDTYCPR
jgi:hypothetical protein